MAMAGIKDPEVEVQEDQDAEMRKRVDRELLAEQKAAEKAAVARQKAAEQAAKDAGYQLQTDPETGSKRPATAPNGGILRRTQNTNVWTDDNEGKAWTRDAQGNLVDAYETLGKTVTDPKTGRKIQSVRGLKPRDLGEDEQWAKKREAAASIDTAANTVGKAKEALQHEESLNRIEKARLESRVAETARKLRAAQKDELDETLIEDLKRQNLEAQEDRDAFVSGESERQTRFVTTQQQLDNAGRDVTTLRQDLRAGRKPTVTDDAPGPQTALPPTPAAKAEDYTTRLDRYTKERESLNAEVQQLNTAITAADKRWMELKEQNLNTTATPGGTNRIIVTSRDSEGNPVKEEWDKSLWEQAQKAWDERKTALERLKPQIDTVTQKAAAMDADGQTLDAESRKVRDEQLAEQRAKLEKLGQQQPGIGKVIPDIQKLDDEFVQALDRIREESANVAPEARPEFEAQLAAMTDEYQAKRERLLQAGEVEQDLIREAASEMSRTKIEQKPGEDFADYFLRNVTEKVNTLAEKAGISKQQASNALEDAMNLESGWGDFEKKRTRLLHNGNVVVNPADWADPDAYRKAVEDSGADQEAKDRAMALLPELRLKAATQIVEAAQAIPAFKDFLDNTPGNIEQKATAFVKEQRKGGWVDQLINRVNAGGAGIGQQAMGVLAALTTTGLAGVEKMGAKSQLGESAQSALHDAMQFWTKRQNAYNVGAELAGTGILANSLTKVAGAGTSLLPALAGSVLTPGNPLLGSALAAAGQSGGGTYAEAFQAGTQQGKAESLAARDALKPAVISAIITGALTYGGGMNGVEGLFRSTTGREAVKTILRRKLVEIGRDVGEEALEEGLDQLAQGVLAASTYNQNKTVPEILNEAFEAAWIGGALGGAVSASTGGADVANELYQGFRDKQAMAQSDAEIQGFQGATPEETTTVTQQAQVLRDIAQGAELGQFTDQQLAVVGLERNENGAIEQGSSKGVPAVKLENGKPIITQGALDALEANFPATRSLIQLDEQEARAQANQDPEEEQPAPEEDASLTPAPESAVAPDAGAGNVSPVEATGDAAGPLPSDGEVEPAGSTGNPAVVGSEATPGPGTGQSTPEAVASKPATVTPERPTEKDSRAVTVPKGTAPGRYFYEYSNEVARIADLNGQQKAATLIRARAKLIGQALDRWAPKLGGVEFRRFGANDSTSFMQVDLDTGRVEIDPTRAIRRFRQFKNAAEIRNYMETALDEEFRHAVTVKRGNESQTFSDNFAAMWQELPDAIKQRSAEVYFARTGATFSPEDDFTAALEFFRQYWQDADLRKITEETASPSLLQRLRDVLNEFIDAIRSIQKGDMLPEVKTRMDALLKEAREAVKEIETRLATTEQTKTEQPAKAENAASDKKADKTDVDFDRAKQLANDWMRQNRNWTDALQEGELESNKAFNAVGEDGKDIPAHGMAKASPPAALDALARIFRDGIRTDNRAEGLHYAPLAKPQGTAGLATTAGGVAVRDGAFILVGKPGMKSFGNAADITAVLVNPALGQEFVDAVQAIVPAGVKVYSYADVSKAVDAAKAAAKPASKPKGPIFKKAAPSALEESRRQEAERSKQGNNPVKTEGSTKKAEFNNDVERIAASIPPSERWGEEKVFISDVYKAWVKENPGVSLGQFKNLLFDNRMKIQLSRLDLVEALTPEQRVKNNESATNFYGDTWNLIRIPAKKPAGAPSVAEEPDDSAELAKLLEELEQSAPEVDDIVALFEFAQEGQQENIGTLAPDAQAILDEVRAIRQSYENRVKDGMPKEDAQRIADDEVDSLNRQDAQTAVREELENVTSLKNADTDAEREARGENPILREAAHTWPEALDKARSILRKDPRAGEALVKELVNAPRAVTDVEAAVLLMQKVAVKQQKEAAQREINGMEDGPEKNSAKQRYDHLKQMENDVDVAAVGVGTSQGRGLNIRKMFLKLDEVYTPEALIQTFQTEANLGAEVSPQEQAEITQHANKIQAAQAKLDATDTEQEVREVKAALDRLRQNMQRDAERVVKKGGDEKAYLKDKAKAARERLKKNRPTGAAEGPRPAGAPSAPEDDLADYGVIGAEYIQEGATTLPDFTAKMVAEFGEDIRPRVPEIFTVSQQAFQTAQQEFAAEKARRERLKTPEGVIEAFRADPTKGLSKELLTNLARAYIRQKVNRTEDIVANIARDVQPLFPGTTESNVRVILSDYGKTTQPTKDELERQLSEVKAESRLLESLERANRGQNPLKSGYQRGPMSQRVRDLTAQVKAAMRKMGIETTREGQLASAKKAAKTRLQNQIEDLQAIIDGKSKPRPDRQTLEYDEELNALVKLRNELKAAVDEMTGESDDVKWNRAATRAAKASEEYYKRRIAAADFSARQKPNRTATAETQKAREDARIAREEFKALRELTGEPQAERLAKQKKRLEEEIEKTQRRLITGQRPNKPGAKPLPPQEIRDLKSQLGRLRQAVRMVEGPNQTDAQRAAILAKATQRTIDELKGRINRMSRGLPDVGRTKREPVEETPELKALRQERAELQEIHDALKEAQNPSRLPEEIALDNFRRATERKREKLERKLKNKEYLEVPTLDRSDVDRAFDKRRLDAQHQLESAKRDWNTFLFNRTLENRPTILKILGTGGEILNTGRAVLTSVDLSAPLRQGGFIAFGNPARAARAVWPMIKAFAKEKYQLQVENEIRNHPNFALAQQAGLYLTDMGELDLTKMEEQYMSRWAREIRGWKGAAVGAGLGAAAGATGLLGIGAIPGAAAGAILGSLGTVEASQRAFVTFLNKLRFDSFNTMVQTLGRDGRVTMEEGAALANYINVATGRGIIGMSKTLEGKKVPPSGNPILSTIFFSPRLMASRFNLLFGQPLYGGNGRTRALVSQEYGKFLVGIGTAMGLAYWAWLAFTDDEEKKKAKFLETDPRSSDFLKARFGNTRLDLFGGILQATVLVSRIVTGKTMKKGELVPLRGPLKPYSGDSTIDVIAKFLRSKLSPAIGSAVNLLQGKDFAGEEVTIQKEILKMTVPMSLQNIKDVMADQGVPKGLTFTLLSLFGAGVQTYETGRDAPKNPQIFTDIVSAWNEQNPDAAWLPSQPNKSSYSVTEKNPETKKSEKREMTPDQMDRYDKLRHDLMADAMAKDPLVSKSDPKAPTPAVIERLKELREKANADARKQALKPAANAGQSTASNNLPAWAKRPTS